MNIRIFNSPLIRHQLRQVSPGRTHVTSKIHVAASRAVAALPQTGVSHDMNRHHSRKGRGLLLPLPPVHFKDVTAPPREPWAARMIPTWSCAAWRSDVSSHEGLKISGVGPGWKKRPVALQPDESSCSHVDHLLSCRGRDKKNLGFYPRLLIKFDHPQRSPVWLGGALFIFLLKWL